MSAEALHMQSVMMFLGMPAKIRLRLDSSAAKAICQRIGVGRVRHLEVRTLWLQSKVREKKLAVVKQDGATNIADIGTKVLATSRFTELRRDLGREHFESDENAKESKAMTVGCISDAKESKVMTVGRISAGSGLEHKLGAMLIAILGCLDKVRAQGECDGGMACVVGGVSYRRDDAAAGAGSWGFVITTLLVLLLAWALGFCVGWKFSKEVRSASDRWDEAPRSLGTGRPVPGGRRGPEACPSGQPTSSSSRSARRSVLTQSPTTYTVQNQQPRFTPLPWMAHGAWPLELLEAGS